MSSNYETDQQNPSEKQNKLFYMMCESVCILRIINKPELSTGTYPKKCSVLINYHGHLSKLSQNYNHVWLLINKVTHK